MSVKTAKLSDLTRGKEIAAGGEGTIHEHPSDNNKVIKIYHKLRPAKFAKHLETLSKLPVPFVVPKTIFVDNTGKVIGFEMDYVDFNNYHLFNNLFNKGFCTSNNIDKAFKIKVLSKMKVVLELLHKNNITVGDLNQYNLFFNKSSEILFVDVDSYQTIDNQHSGVLLDDIRDWTTTDINDKTDVWAYDILAFWATTYCHPYKWVVPGNKESLELRVKTNRSILSSITGIKIPPLYDPPVDDALKQFKEIFTGRRYMVSFSGVHVPVSAVVKQVITSNSLTIRELYTNVAKINACYNKIGVKFIGSDDWLLVETAIQKVTRQLSSIGFSCYELYPSEKNFAYVEKNGNNYQLKSQLPGVYAMDFFEPVFVFDYNDGFLTIIDTKNDKQFNYNLNNQLGGIDNTITPVFAKSIIKRDGLIQNFGSQKYANIPFNNSYTLSKVPFGTKNVYSVRGFSAVEYRNQSRSEFIIQNMNGVKQKEFDYFPYFAVQGKSKVLFVPDDGCIDIYSFDLQFIMRFDCSMCTRDSKLYATDSGIIMLESNTLYLLNTK